MPAEDYNHFGDADLGAIVGFLKALPAINTSLPGSEIRPIGRVLFATGQLPLLPAVAIDRSAPRTVAPSAGITPGSEDSWSATNSSTEPFQLVYLKFDSDQALATAQKHGGTAQLKKTADLPVNFRLNWEPRKTMLVWHVVYGQSINDPQLDVVVDATTNQYVRVEK